MKPMCLATFAFAAMAGPAIADGVPSINIEPSCRSAEVGIMKQAAEACRRSEQSARDALVKQWDSFPAADRASCYRLTTTGTPGTYTELLTCLELKQVTRNLPEPSGTVGLGGSRR
jgi:hypothetical protein